MMHKNILLKSIKTIAPLGIMGILLYPTVGLCQSVFTEALDNLYTTFTEARSVVYVTAGFGLVGVAVAAISGKLPWKWFTMIAVALFTLASAEKIAQYVSGVGTNTSLDSGFTGTIEDDDFVIETTNTFDLNRSNTYHKDQNFVNSLTN